MDRPFVHDRAVEAIRATLARSCRGRGDWVVLSRVRRRWHAAGSEYEPVSPCGPVELEEELFGCSRLLNAAIERAGRDRREVEGLTAKVNRLQAQLGGLGS